MKKKQSKGKLSCPIDGNANWHSHYGKQYECYSKKTLKRTTLESSNSTSSHSLNKNTNSKFYMHPHVHYSIIYKIQDTEAT